MPSGSASSNTVSATPVKDVDAVEEAIDADSKQVAYIYIYVYLCMYVYMYKRDWPFRTLSMPVSLILNWSMHNLCH